MSSDTREIRAGRWLQHAERLLKEISQTRFYARPYAVRRALAAVLPFT